VDLYGRVRGPLVSDVTKIGHSFSYLNCRNIDLYYKYLYVAHMEISWDLIRSFQMVAKTGSLSAASRALNLTQPTVGRHIDLLEEALHIPLFVRSREGM
jgi:DNA-binding transcriptional ArsR family regulator